MIAHATKRAITEQLDEDPAFYEKFSKLIQQAIDDYRARRMSDLEYLKRATEIKDAVVNRKVDDLPAVLHGNDQRDCLFRIAKTLFRSAMCRCRQAKMAADAAVRHLGHLRAQPKGGILGRPGRAAPDHERDRRLSL